MENFTTLHSLLDHFKEESVCIEYLENQRWNGKPVCPHCGFDEKIYKTNRGYKCGNKECHKKFTVTVGTFFENTKISLRYWFAAMYLCTAHKKGISSLQLSRDLGIQQKTAWFLLHRIREMLKDREPSLLENDVEIDETYIGGKEKNKHKSKRTEGTQGRSVKSKTAVLGILERKGNIVVTPVVNTSAGVIQPIMVNAVKPGSNIHTDEWRGYSGLEKDFNHSIVRHGIGEYVVGLSHTNTVEGFWSLLKRSIYGIYHNVSPKHLDKYCTESAFRYNTRKIDNQERFEVAVRQCKGRLKYNELTKKFVS